MGLNLISSLASLFEMIKNEEGVISDRKVADPHACPYLLHPLSYPYACLPIKHRVFTVPWDHNQPLCDSSSTSRWGMANWIGGTCNSSTRHVQHGSLVLGMDAAVLAPQWPLNARLPCQQRREKNTRRNATNNKQKNKKSETTLQSVNTVILPTTPRMWRGWVWVCVCARVCMCNVCCQQRHLGF